MVVFHDLASPDVERGLDVLRREGWSVLVYQTMQIMGVAWRGQVRPVAHTPDPSVIWSLPLHLAEYRVSGASRDEEVGRLSLRLAATRREIDRLRSELSSAHAEADNLRADVAKRDAELSLLRAQARSLRQASISDVSRLRSRPETRRSMRTWPPLTRPRGDPSAASSGCAQPRSSVCPGRSGVLRRASTASTSPDPGRLPDPCELSRTGAGGSDPYRIDRDMKSPGSR